MQTALICWEPNPIRYGNQQGKRAISISLSALNDYQLYATGGYMLFPRTGELQLGDIVGMILGDAWIEKGKDCKNPRLRMKHCINQEGYAKLKADLLGSEFSVSISPNRSYLKETGKFYDGVLVSTNHDRKLLEIWKRTYPHGKKVVPDFLTSITPRGLALWYMDDGSLIVHTRVRNNKRRYDGWNTTLATDCFTLEDQQKLTNTLKNKFDIAARITKKNNQFYLYINATESKKLFNIVKPYMSEDMMYKVNYESKVEKIKQLLHKQDDDIVWHSEKSENTERNMAT